LPTGGTADCQSALHRSADWQSAVSQAGSLQPTVNPRMHRAVWRNRGASGVEEQTVQQLDQEAASELARLEEALRTGRYRRQPARRVWIEKPGTTEQRPLGIPAVRDRTVEAALRHVLEPIFERGADVGKRWGGWRRS
jgi:retron-type reverse transcriptase